MKKKLDPGYYVWCIEVGVPRFRHEVIEAAEIEAERLARANPGQQFTVIRVFGQVSVADIVWYCGASKEVPF